MTDSPCAILLLSSNDSKIREYRFLFSKLLAGKAWSLSSRDVDAAEIQAVDAAQVGREKLKTAVQALGSEAARAFDLIVCDDTGLHAAAMNQLPGALIKWFIQGMGIEGLVAFAAGKGLMQATAVCALSAYVPKDGSVHAFTGKADGILVPPRGARTFGWDPVFVPAGCQKTFAEMSQEEKSTCSHRAAAVRLLSERFGQGRT